MLPLLGSAAQSRAEAPLAGHAAVLESGSLPACRLAQRAKGAVFWRARRDVRSHCRLLFMRELTDEPSTMRFSRPPGPLVRLLGSLVRTLPGQSPRSSSSSDEPRGECFFANSTRRATRTRRPLRVLSPDRGDPFRVRGLGPVIGARPRAHYERLVRVARPERPRSQALGSRRPDALTRAKKAVYQVGTN